MPRPGREETIRHLLRSAVAECGVLSDRRTVRTSRFFHGNPLRLRVVSVRESRTKRKDVPAADRVYPAQTLYLLFAGTRSVTDTRSSPRRTVRLTSSPGWTRLNASVTAE